MATATENIIERIRGNEPAGMTAPELRDVLQIPLGTATSRTSTLAKLGRLKAQGKRGRSTVYVLSQGIPTGMPATPALKVTTHYCLVLDASSSMNDVRGRREGAARLLDNQVEAIRKSGLDATISVVQFADSAWKSNHWASPESSFIYPGCYGNTALIDALLMAINDCLTGVATVKVVLAFTDGEENHSLATWERFKAVLAAETALGGFTLAIMVPKGSVGESQLLRAGVPAGNIRAWDNIDVAEREATQATENFTAEVKTSGGLTRSAKQYFTADLSKVGAAALDDLNVASTACVWVAPIETTTEELVTARTKKPYVPGTGFFEVMKREPKIPEDRKFLLFDPKTKITYSDGKRTIRSYCGFPKRGEIAVLPGNHAGLVLLCQSKSSSKDTFRARILPRGTRCAWWPEAVT